MCKKNAMHIQKFIKINLTKDLTGSHNRTRFISWIFKIEKERGGGGGGGVGGVGGGGGGKGKGEGGGEGGGGLRAQKRENRNKISLIQPR